MKKKIVLAGILASLLSGYAHSQESLTGSSIAIHLEGSLASLLGRGEGPSWSLRFHFQNDAVSRDVIGIDAFIATDGFSSTDYRFAPYPVSSLNILDAESFDTTNIHKVNWVVVGVVVVATAISKNIK